MAEFSAAANLDVQVDPSSIAAAKRDIEQELGDASVSVNAQSMAPDGTGGETGTARGQRAGVLDASRQQLDVQGSLADMAETRNEHLEDIADALEGGAVGGGGGGGGMGFLSGFGARGILSGASSAAGGVLGGGITSISMSAPVITATAVTITAGFAALNATSGSGGFGFQGGEGPEASAGASPFSMANMQIFGELSDEMMKGFGVASLLSSGVGKQAILEFLFGGGGGGAQAGGTVGAGPRSRGDDAGAGTQPGRGELQGPTVSFTVQNDIRSEDTGLTRDEVRRIRRIAKAEAKAMRDELEREIMGGGAGVPGSGESDPLRR